MSSAFARKLKEKRDWFIDNYLMSLNALKKSRYRLRQREGAFAYVAKDSSGLKFLYAPSDLKIGITLNESGGWQREELNHYLDFVTARARGKKACFFDMGANIGTQAVYASKSGLFSKVFAIEAIPYIYELLTANVVLNECTDNTICFNKALGAEYGQEKFLFNPLNPGHSKRDDGDINCREIVLDVVKTADFVSERVDGEGRPDILVFWIDVEGMEEEIVLDLQELCTDFEAYFCIEYNSDNYRDAPGLSLRSFVESREEVYRLDTNGLQAIPDLSEVQHNQDIVFSGKAR